MEITFSFLSLSIGVLGAAGGFLLGNISAQRDSSACIVILPLPVGRSDEEKKKNNNGFYSSASAH